MSQIVTINAIPYRANLVACQTGSLKDEVLDSGEYLAISTPNNIDAKGQGTLDSYIIGDGVTTVSQLVSTSLHTLGGGYEKPSTGIPASDLEQSVQDSLNEANTAVQPSALNDYYTKTEINGMIGDINSALDTINGEVI